MNTSIAYVDNSLCLPDALFNEPPAWCQHFVQDAKVQGDRVYTCEFGAGTASYWDDYMTPALIKAMQVLNTQNRIWFMIPEGSIQRNREIDGNNAYAHIVQKALAPNGANRIGLNTSGTPLPAFPSTSESEEFNPTCIKSYATIGITAFPTLPADIFRTIEGTQKPALLLDEGSGSGPCIRIYGYKHLSRLLINQTEAAGQNPPYVMVEIAYTPELAHFLKSRFPHDQKLVLKHVAAARGEGVFILSATDVETLDRELRAHFQNGSEFRQRSPLSICLVESFISTPVQDGNLSREKVSRFSYLVLKNNNQIEVHVTGGSERVSSDAIDTNTRLASIVKVGFMKTASDDTCARIQQIVERDIACIARRAISYQPQEAVRFFLTSDNHILNLIGIELFYPRFICLYRELHNNHGVLVARVSDEQCDLLIDLVKKNKSQIVRERICENIIFHDFSMAYNDPDGVILCSKLGKLMLALYENTPPGAFREKLASFLAFACTNTKSTSMAAFAEPVLSALISSIRIS